MIIDSLVKEHQEMQQNSNFIHMNIHCKLVSLNANFKF